MCSCDHCCCGKAINITYSEFMFVALGIKHAMCMRHIAICVLPRSTIFCQHHMIFGKKVTEHKMCVLIFPTTFV